jgi:hypothetical protein
MERPLVVLGRMISEKVIMMDMWWRKSSLNLCFYAVILFLLYCEIPPSYFHSVLLCVSLVCVKIDSQYHHRAADSNWHLHHESCKVCDLLGC